MRLDFFLQFFSLQFLSYLAIIADRFYRATRECFFTKIRFLWRLGLLKHKGITILIGTHEIVGGSVATNITVDARRIDVISSRNVLFNFVSLIRQDGLEFRIWDFVLIHRLRRLHRFEELRA